MFARRGAGFGGSVPSPESRPVYPPEPVPRSAAGVSEGVYPNQTWPDLFVMEHVWVAPGSHPPVRAAKRAADVRVGIDPFDRRSDGRDESGLGEGTVLGVPATGLDELSRGQAVKDNRHVQITACP